MVCGYWLVMGNVMTWFPMICCIAYLAMDCDIMLHTRNAMWIHWFILLALQMVVLFAEIANVDI